MGSFNMSKIKNTIAFKFILGMVAIMFISRMVGMTITGNSQRATLESGFLVRGEGLTKAMADVSAEFILGYIMTMLENITNNLQEQHGIVWAAFYDAEKSPLTSQQPVIDDSIASFSKDVLFEGDKVGELKIGFSRSPTG